MEKKRTYDVLKESAYYRVVRSHLNGKNYLQKKSYTFLFFYKWKLIAIPFKDADSAFFKATIASIKMLEKEIKEFKRY